MTPSLHPACQAVSIIPLFFDKMDVITAPKVVEFEEAIPLIALFRQMQFVCKEIATLDEEDARSQKKLVKSIALLRSQILKPSQAAEEPSQLKEYSVEECKTKLARFATITEYVILTLRNHPHFQNATDTPPPSSYLTEFGNTLLKSMYDKGMETVQLRYKSPSFEETPTPVQAFRLANCIEISYLTKTIPVGPSSNELSLMQLCCNPNIDSIGMITNTTETAVTFTLPLRKNLSFDQVPFPKKDLLTALEILLGCFRGLAHMHSCKVVHNNISLENLTVQTVANKETCVETGVVTNFASASLADAASFAGTADYYPPEFPLSQEDPPKRHPAMDVWAMGVVLFEILYGKSSLMDYLDHTHLEKSDPDYWFLAKKLFYEKVNSQELFDKFVDEKIASLKEKTPSEFDPNVESFLTEAMKMCLKLDPEERSSSEQLITFFEQKVVELELADITLSIDFLILQ